jgi:hypothetical protein
MEGNEFNALDLFFLPLGGIMGVPFLWSPLLLHQHLLSITATAYTVNVTFRFIRFPILNF